MSMKIRHRALAALLTLCMFATLIPCMSTPSAAVNVTGDVVEARIEELTNLLEGEYFNVNNGDACGYWTRRHGNECCKVDNVIRASWFKDMFGDVSVGQLPSSGSKSCVGFVFFAGWYIFRADNSDYVTSKYMGSFDFTYENILEHVRPGDYLYLNDKGHAVIFIDCDEEGITVLECNRWGTYNCQVHKGRWEYANNSTRAFGMCRFYSDKNGRDDSTFETPLKISPTYYPKGTIKQEDLAYGLPLSGTVSSGQMITHFQGEVLDENGTVVLTASQSTSTKSLSIRRSKVDLGLEFSKLNAGTYQLRYIAKDKSGTQKEWLSEKFTVAGTCGQHSYKTVQRSDGAYVAVCKNCAAEFGIGALDTSAKGTYTPSGEYATVRTYPYQEAPGTKIMPGETLNVVGAVTNAYGNVWYKLADSRWVFAERVNKVAQACTSHTRGSFLFFEAAHPHYNYYMCGNCGVSFTDGTTANVESCITCNPPKEEPVWSNWSDWSTTPVSASASRQVETRQVQVSNAYTEYRYGRYVSNGHDCWCGTYLASRPYSNGSINTEYSSWSTTRQSVYDSGWTCGECSGNHSGYYETDSQGREFWHEYRIGGKSYWWEESRTVPAQYRAEYRYRDRV